MPVNTEPSTFEFARDWLVSSEAFVRDAMLAEAPDLDTSRDQARERIHREEALDQPNEDDAGEAAPDQPPAIASRPHAIIITRDDRRARVGTGTWAGQGQMLICIEVLVPQEYQVNDEEDDPDTRAATFAARREWAAQLCKTIRAELRATSGLGDANGTPYLDATNINLHLAPGDPEQGEEGDFVGWIYEVDWK